MDKEVFKKNVEIDEENNKIIITVECQMRKFSIEKKRFFDKSEIDDLIPEQYKTKVLLLEKPSGRIANVDLKDTTNVGKWVYEIVRQQPAVEQNPTRKRRTRRTTTTKKRS